MSLKMICFWNKFRMWSVLMSIGAKSLYNEDIQSYKKIDSCASINMSFNLHMVYTIRDLTKHDMDEALFVMII